MEEETGLIQCNWRAVLGGSSASGGSNGSSSQDPFGIERGQLLAAGLLDRIFFRYYCILGYGGGLFYFVSQGAQNNLF